MGTSAGPAIAAHIAINTAKPTLSGAPTGIPVQPAPSDAGRTGPFDFVQEYWLDAAQRSVLFLDALRRRGDKHFEHAAQLAPNVLSFAYDVVLDGRTLPRPVNYGLVRIIPPDAQQIDPRKRPFIVFDPRAGHGPGIGGMKQDSEIGVALAAGHPCYFVGFLPDAMPGQTIEDVCRAEALFLETVIRLHPEADSKPCLIGNCQAGWQIMMMCALRPELAGPILLAGAPLSYWAGVRGRNPMRYTGGLLGGSWLTALNGDLGHGTFDGAHLIANFESMNPANTYWKKSYAVYSKVDTEASRFLDFETWWGSPVTLNAEEMQFIVDELFVGNKLTAGAVTTSDGARIDLRNIRSPIIVFCSWGDDITPPQQALGWLLDLYGSDEEMISSGQTVVYTVHQSIGHLGIFVSGKIAAKEHAEFTSCMDMIDTLPPGLFEAIIEDCDNRTRGAELIHGKYLFKLEGRGLADIRALGSNSAEDQRRFETVARVSEVNHALYHQFLAPAVRAMTTEQSAAALRRLHPHRVRFEVFSSRNPLMQPIAALAEAARNNRRPAHAGNPLMAMQTLVSTGIAGMLEAFGTMRDVAVENTFLAIYGSPVLQALVGLGTTETRMTTRMGRDLAREAGAERLALTLEQRVERGDLMEAMLRSVIHILRADRRLDERGVAVFEALREAQPPSARISRERFREIVRDQSLILRRDEARAVAAIPKLLPADAEARAKAADIIHRSISVQDPGSEESARRLAHVTALFRDAAEPGAINGRPAAPHQARA